MHLYAFLKSILINLKKYYIFANYLDNLVWN
jgi:hypothetical protein